MMRPRTPSGWPEPPKRTLRKRLSRLRHVWLPHYRKRASRALDPYGHLAVRLGLAQERRGAGLGDRLRVFRALRRHLSPKERAVLRTSLGLTLSGHAWAGSSTNSLGMTPMLVYYQRRRILAKLQSVLDFSSSAS